MRGCFPNPIARPIRSRSVLFAPTTRAMREVGTNGQLRHTNACKRLGKWSKLKGTGALPTGRIVPPDSAALARQSHCPRMAPPVMVADNLRKSRRKILTAPDVTNRGRLNNALVSLPDVGWLVALLATRLDRRAFYNCILCGPGRTVSFRIRMRVSNPNPLIL